MIKDDDIPLVTAVAVVETTPTTTTLPATTAAIMAAQPTIYIVDLPNMMKTSDLGFQIVGSPPRISNLSEKAAASSSSPLYGKVTNGHYIHGIVLPEITIDNLSDSNHLIQLIDANVGTTSRSLIVSPSSNYSDPINNKQNGTAGGPLYKHELPINIIDLGIGLDGFPPAVTFVRLNSPLAGRIHPGQGIHALVIPGQPILNLQSGGFTHANVLKKLTSTSHIVGRQLIVKDGALPPKRQKGSDAAFDDCVIL